MDRHYKIIFEAILSILILLELLFLILITIGFIAGIKNYSLYAFGIWDMIIGILILLICCFLGLLKGINGIKSFFGIIGHLL